MQQIYKILQKYSTYLLVLFLIAIYALTLRGTPGNLHPNATGQEKIVMNNPPFETSMERGRYAQIISLAEQRTFTVDQFADFLKPDLAWYNGHYYPSFPPGVAVLALPAYLIGKYFSLSQITTYATTALFSILTALVILKIGSKLNLTKRASILSALVFALGSCAFAYTVTLSAHPISAFLTALCFLASISIIKGQKTFLNFALLWFAYAINIFIDYPNLFILFPLIVITLLKAIDRKTIANKIRFVIPLTMVYGAIILFPILYFFVDYSMFHYGKPFAFTNTFNTRVLYIQGIKYEQLSNDLFDKKAYTSRFDITKLNQGIFILLFSTDRGLFFFSPVFLLALGGILLACIKKESGWEIILLTFLADLAVYGSFDDPWGGWGFGPRYLIPSLPLMALMVGRSFDYLINFKLKFISQSLITILIIYGIAVSLMGALGSNAIPPSIEAPYAKMHDNFLASWDYLSAGNSSSFIFNTFLDNSLVSLNYFYIVFALIVLCKLCIIWLPPNNPDSVGLPPTEYES